MIEIICKLLDISKPTFFRYKKKEVPIISFLTKYFKKKDIEEFLNSGHCEKLENLNFILDIINYKIQTLFFKNLKKEEELLLREFVKEVWNRQKLNLLLKSIDRYEYNTSLFINHFKNFAKDKEELKTILQKFQLLDIPEKYFLLKDSLNQIVDSIEDQNSKVLKISIIEDDPQQASFLKNAMEIEFEYLDINIFDTKEKIKNYTYQNENLIFMDYYLTSNFWLNTKFNSLNALDIIKNIRKHSKVKIIVTSEDIEKELKDVENIIFLTKGTSEYLNKVLTICNTAQIK